MVLIKISAFMAALALLAGYLGAIHPLFDSLAIGRPLAAIWLLLAGFAFRRKLRICAIIFAFFALVPIAISAIPNKHISAPKFALYQHNLLFNNRAPDLALVARQLSPDVITLQEISSARENIQSLENYPNQVVCKFATVGDVGVLSKHPFIDQGCSEGHYRGFAWARIQNSNGDEVTVVSIHTHWPYPFGQAMQLDELLPQLKMLQQPIVLSGDFNQVGWSHAVSTLAKSVGGEDKTGLILTLVRPPLFLPIDHVIAPKSANVHVEKLNRYGSDHNGLFARFENWPQ